MGGDRAFLIEYIGATGGACFGVDHIGPGMDVPKVTPVYKRDRLPHILAVYELIPALWGMPIDALAAAAREGTLKR